MRNLKIALKGSIDFRDVSDVFNNEEKSYFEAVETPGAICPNPAALTRSAPIRLGTDPFTICNRRLAQRKTKT